MMSMLRRPMQRVAPVLACACVIFAAACSDSGSGSGSESAGDPLVTVAAAPAEPADTLSSNGDPQDTQRKPAEVIGVDASIEIESIGLDTEVSGELDPSALDLADPFGAFVSCSGARRAFGPYSVLVSSPSGQVVSVSVFAAGSVMRTGIHDADVRVELRSGSIESATGTVTIDTGWRSGSFVTFTADGRRVTGDFECRGGDPSPAPLDVTDTADVLDAIEVVTLLRRDGTERVVGLAVETARSPEVMVACAAALGTVADDAQLLARVDGDQTVGAITTFELTGGGAPTLSMLVGGVSYEFDDVEITLGEPASAGTFRATADGVTVDGAFRCT